MGIIGMINKTKKGFQDTRIKIIKGQTASIQEANLREAELTRIKTENREARQIKADLKAEQMKTVEGEQPSKLKKLGMGMSKHMNKKTGGKTGKPVIGVPKSVTNQPTSTQQGGIFGGQRNIEVGGTKESPFMHKRKRDLF